MKWKDFFEKTFGIDSEAEMETETEERKTETEEKKITHNDTSANINVDIDMSKQLDLMQSQINELQAVNAELVKVNQALALNAQGEPQKTSEEILRDAFALE